MFGHATAPESSSLGLRDTKIPPSLNGHATTLAPTTQEQATVTPFPGTKPDEDKVTTEPVSAPAAIERSEPAHTPLTRAIIGGEAVQSALGEKNVFTRARHWVTRSKAYGATIVIDLGTQNTKMRINKHEILVEPTFVCVDMSSGEKVVTFIGEQAKRGWGKDTRNSRVICPMAEGVVKDHDNTKHLLRHMLERYTSMFGMVPMRSTVLFAVPTGTEQTNALAAERVITEAWKPAKVMVVDEIMAAAVGTGADTYDPDGVSVIDFGGGTVNFGVIARNDLAENGYLCVKGGGRAMNHAIIAMVQRELKTTIGEAQAEEIKEAVGYAVMPSDNPIFHFGGRVRSDRIDKLERRSVYAAQVHEAIKPQLQEIYDGVERLLSTVPPEMSGSILDKGAYLTGGGSALKNLSEGIRINTGLETVVATNAREAVVTGLWKIGQSEELMKKMAVAPRNWVSKAI